MIRITPEMIAATNEVMWTGKGPMVGPGEDEFGFRATGVYADDLFDAGLICHGLPEDNASFVPSERGWRYLIHLDFARA